MTKALLLKTRPNLNRKIKTLIKTEKNLLLVSLTDYIQEKLKKQGFQSQLFNTLSPFKDIQALHKELENKYNSLCRAWTNNSPLDYFDLLRNHLCWEIENEYYFLVTLNRWLKKHKINKLYWENITLIKKTRYAGNINQLVSNFYKDKRYVFKKI